MAKQWRKVGSVLKKREGEGFYIKISDDVELRKDMILTLQDPRKRKGITEEQLARIPDFVKFEVSVPPSEE